MCRQSCGRACVRILREGCVLTSLALPLALSKVKVVCLLSNVAFSCVGMVYGLHVGFCSKAQAECSMPLGYYSTKTVSLVGSPPYVAPSQTWCSSLGLTIRILVCLQEISLLTTKCRRINRIKRKSILHATKETLESVLF